ncbi:probable cytochrome P450 313a4 [Musca vetustissima]|uniref:probable cytochrome P450 313a4 n=1 Tax=Musca vetustissima TaxID=27455 RepID=UPI002AB7770F|nr:probable cytochrome P450 313a4 [Musca vetustissima]
MECSEKLGQNFVHFIGPFPQFVTGDPETVKDVLTSKICLSKDYITYGGLYHALGEGLLTIQAKGWQQHRKFMEPGFKFSKIVGFLPVFNRRMPGLFEKMDKCNAMQDSYNILVYCREFTIGITGETMMGRDLDKSPTVNVNYYSELIAGIMEYMSEITLNVLYQPKLILKLADLTVFRKQRKVLEFLQKEIDETYRYYSSDCGTDPQYLDTADNVVAKYINEAISNNIIDRKLAITSIMHLFGAAFETTSSTIYFTILMLAMHPEYQEKAYTEICELFSDNDKGEFEMTYQDISQLNYLDMFIKETMRVFPTVPLFARKVCGGDLSLSNGMVIPDGQEIVLNTYNLHRNKSVWGPQANIFNPDNFLPSNVAKRHPYAFVPFSKGIRFCIGMRYAELSIRVAMAKLIKRYKFSTTAKVEDLVLYNHISLQLSKYPPIMLTVGSGSSSDSSSKRGVGK